MVGICWVANHKPKSGQQLSTFLKGKKMETKVKSNINYETVQKAVAKNAKEKMQLIIFLYKTWAKESDRLASLPENPFGATGFTVGKFIAEWSKTLEYEHQKALAVSFKKRIEEMHRVALKGIDINKILDTKMLAENALLKTPAVKPAKVGTVNALFNTKEFKALPADVRKAIKASVK
jgi:hypothetical protein